MRHDNSLNNDLITNIFILPFHSFLFSIQVSFSFSFSIPQILIHIYSIYLFIEGIRQRNHIVRDFFIPSIISHRKSHYLIFEIHFTIAIATAIFITSRSTCCTHKDEKILLNTKSFPCTIEKAFIFLCVHFYSIHFTYSRSLEIHE